MIDDPRPAGATKRISIHASCCSERLGRPPTGTSIGTTSRLSCARRQPVVSLRGSEPEPLAWPTRSEFVPALDRVHRTPAPRLCHDKSVIDNVIADEFLASRSPAANAFGEATSDLVVLLRSDPVTPIGGQARLLPARRSSSASLNPASSRCGSVRRSVTHSRAWAIAAGSPARSARRVVASPGASPRAPGPWGEGAGQQTAALLLRQERGRVARPPAELRDGRLALLIGDGPEGHGHTPGCRPQQQ
jgi:hypothetical protein